MVTGITSPSGFGDYSPHGEYVDWDVRLKNYYDHEMSEAEKAEMGMQERILYSKFANKFLDDKGPVKPHEWPMEFRTRVTYPSLASLIMLPDRLLAVDETLKGLIEELEPSVHQFSPLRIVMPKGKEYPQQFYVMVIRQFVDSFSPDRSEEGSWYRREFGLCFVQVSTRQAYEGLALSKQLFGSSHLWRERWLKNPNIFVSDRLQAAIAGLGLRIPKHYSLKAV